MRRINDRNQFRRGLAMFLVLGLGLGSAAPWRSQAAQVASQIKLDSDDLNQPILLDQNGQAVHLPTKRHPGPVVLADGAVPSYVAYRVDSDGSLPKGFPTVVTGPKKAGQMTTGPLHLNALVKARLDQALAQDGTVAVHNGKDTFLVKPLSPLFGTPGPSSGNSQVWLASQASTSGSSSNSSSGTAKDSVPTSVPSAQTLIPSSLTNPITNSKLVKDLQHLLAIKSGKLVNWNQQSLDALKSDLRIGSPKNVAPHLATTSNSVHAAQMLDVSSTSAGAAGTPQPAPIPEPSTLVIFGLAAGAWAVRQKLGRRK